MAQYCHISAGADNYEARSSKNIPTAATIWSRECHGIVWACHKMSQCHNNLTMSVCHAGLGSECTFLFTKLPNIKMNKVDYRLAVEKVKP